ncbi:uncharacterized protein LOC141711229 [Apium graveolens]|uniref:uncharacterized protein LOC141711229 n=1 Tax=Apium graveolens TaxID=4045 RepID=UPI003D7B81E6
MDLRSHSTSARTTLIGLKCLIRSRDSSNEDANQSSVLQHIPSLNVPDSTDLKRMSRCVGLRPVGGSNNTPCSVLISPISGITLEENNTPTAKNMDGAAALSDITNASGVENNSIAGMNTKPSSTPSDMNNKKCRIRGPNIEKMYTNAMHLGPPSKLCNKYDATMWNEERNNKSCPHKKPTFSLYCRNDQIHLPKERPPSEPLASLLLGGEKSRHFKQYIKVYNCMFQFTSTGSKIDNSINRGSSPYCFRLQGQNYHLVESLVLLDGSSPKFCQLYIYDTPNEVENRINAMGGASDNVDPDIIEELLGMLDKNNELVKAFRMAQNRFENEDLDEFKLVFISSQSSSGRPNHITPSDEVVAFIVSDDTDTGGFRDTVVNSKQEGLKRIYETDPHFMQLQYPLPFPWGTKGYHKRIPLISNKYSEIENLDDEDLDPDSTQRQHVSLGEYCCYKIMIRTFEGLTPHLAGSLWQQYVVNQFASIEQYRLDWVSAHQTTIRADLYNYVRDSLSKGDHDPMLVGKAVILPDSFTGSQRYMSQYFRDFLVICRAIGHPSLFFTMTCNSKWPEIQEMLKLLPNVDHVDAPDIVSCVFKLKLDQLLDLIKKKNYFGKCIGVMHVIEFQKHGLPHMHMLIWPSPESRPNSIEKVDQLVSAEIPDKNSDPIAYEAVKNYMMHGPCGLIVIPILMILVFLFIGGVKLCHINLEICNSSRSLKYLFKYCLKGHDTATMLLKKKSNKSGSEQTARSVKNLDEVKNFLDGRYVCASEASWRIFGFDIHHRSPSVERLPIHFPGQKYLNFQSSADLGNVCNNANSKKSKLEAWFVANSEFPQDRNFMYSDFPTHFTWIKKTAKWKLRQIGDVVGRLAEVHTTTGELLYPRMLLLRCKGVLSFTQLRTIDGTTYDTFKEACGALGLLNNDKQWHDALEENAFSAMPTQIRAMLVNILANYSVSDPLALWEKHWPALSDDVLYARRKISNNIHLTLSEYEIKNYVLAEIEKLLNDVGKSLRDFHMMPFLDERFFHTFVNRLIVEETSYNKEELRLNHEKAHKNLNSRQLDVYNAVVDNVNKNKGGMFFVYRSGGCGNSEVRNKVIADFSKWQLEIGDGRVECIDTHRADIETEFVVPDEYVVKSPLKSPIKTLIDIIYPDFQNNLHSQEYMRSRSILTPTNIVVDDINAQILEGVSGNVHTYLSQDSIEDRGVDDNDFDSSFPVEYLNSINMPCLPKYELKVKVKSCCYVDEEFKSDYGSMYLAAATLQLFLYYNSELQKKRCIPYLSSIMVIVHSLSSLDIYSRNLRIRVRVTRLWHTNNREGVFVGCNLILLDPQAFVRADIWNSFNNTIVEGQMYEITNFITTHVSSILRPVRSALKIVFTPLTTVQTMYPNDLDQVFIERHNFEFVSLPQLAINPESYALDRTFAIGVAIITNTLASKFYINPGVQEVFNFRHWLEGMGYDGADSD